MKAKKILKIVVLLFALLVVGVAGFAGFEVMRFDASMKKVYSIPVPNITRSTDPAVIERGNHLAHSVAACATRDCHGADLGGGQTIDIGPLGRMTGPNLTLVAMGYSDGELARLVRHGVKADGRSVRFMAVGEINWISDADLTAIISWIRTMPVVQRASGPMQIGLLGKILDRRDVVPLDVARRVAERGPHDLAPPPSPTAAYGGYIARACIGCHGEHYSGGRIPGAPSSLPIPANITADASGIHSWTYEDFERFSHTGVRPNGSRVNPFMPIEILNNMDDTERHATWEFLRSVPPRPYGQR
jgi:hypothetical protein